MNSCIKCGCQEAFPSLPPCPVPAACPNPQPCAEVFDAQCIVFTLPDIECGNDIVVAQDSSIAEALDSIVAYFCQSVKDLTDCCDTNTAAIIEINENITLINEAIDAINIEIHSINNSKVDSVTGLNTDNTDPQNPIVKISVDGTTITGLGTPASPLVATSGGGSIGGSGTTNYIPRWTPNGTTLGNSLMNQIGSCISIDNASPIVACKLYVETTTQTVGAYVKNSFNSTLNTNYEGIIGIVDGTITNGQSIGIVGGASGNSNVNIGGAFTTAGVTIGTNIGITCFVQGGSLNYGAQLRDGTEGIGKMLASVTATGHSNWSKVTSSYTTGASGSFTSVDGKTITVTNGLITNIV